MGPEREAEIKRGKGERERESERERERKTSLEQKWEFDCRFVLSAASQRMGGRARRGLMNWRRKGEEDIGSEGSFAARLSGRRVVERGE